MLMLSAMEEKCSEIAVWIEASLKGRLKYREEFLEECRAGFPKVMRQLLSGMLKCKPPAHNVFDERVRHCPEAAVVVVATMTREDGGGDEVEVAAAASGGPRRGGARPSKYAASIIENCAGRSGLVY